MGNGVWLVVRSGIIAFVSSWEQSNEKWRMEGCMVMDNSVCSIVGAGYWEMAYGE